MTVESIIARARQRHADVMDTTVTVKRKGGGGVYDSSTQTYDPGTWSTVYDGQAIVHGARSQSVELRSGEDGAVLLPHYTVKLPVAVAPLRGDSITVTASTHDSALVGLTVWVLDVEQDEWATTRVAYCTDQIAEVHP